MALTNDSASSAAVREALLAFASVHRHGLQSQGFEFKISAIRALGKASHTNIGVTEALQHVAACMLLCAFEIHTASCTSSQWWCYVNGVKQVLNASALLPFRNDSSFAALLDWVFTMRRSGGLAFCTGGLRYSCRKTVGLRFVPAFVLRIPKFGYLTFH